MTESDFHQLFGSFIAETREFLQALETHLLAIENCPTHEERLHRVKEMFRAAHSIKGAALMFGIEDLSKAAHTLEDCFAILRDRANLSQLKSEEITYLLQGVDGLRHLTTKVEAGETNTAGELESIAQIKQQFQATYGVKEQPAPWVSQSPVGAGVIKAIFENEIPGVISRLEGEISQIQPETLEKSLAILNEIYYQISGVAGMLQLPELHQIADNLRALIDFPNLEAPLLQSAGWVIAQNLQTAREQILQGQSIQVQEIEPLKQVNPDKIVALNSPNSEISTEDSTQIQPDVSSELTAEVLTSTPSVPLPIASAPTLSRPTIRVDLERLTELVNLVGELVINRTNLELQESQLRSEVKRVRRRILELNQYGSQLREEYDRLSVSDFQRTALTAQNFSQLKQATTQNHSSYSQPSLLQELQVFDALEMDEYTEFHSTAQSVIETTQSIAQSATKIEELTGQFERSTDRLRRITDQLRTRVMQLRVVPFSRAVDHVPRALRDLCQTYNKEVNLLLLGRETKIDESLLDALRDPLVHLVRNAFDHGIESPEIRKAAGKPVTGQIEIEAYHQGGQTIITITDDGQGIDPEKIRRTVVEKEYLPAEQAQQLSITELYEFLFLPGFSTRDQVNDLSGRGVGLDVVRNNLRQVRGTIKVDSRVGKGTSFILKLPLMLSITQALLVRTDHNTVAIPLDAVEEILHIQPTQIHKAGNQPMLRWRGEFIRLVRLQELLQYSIPHPDGPSPDPITQDYIPVIVLASSEGIMAIVVERLAGQQEIVVKPLPAPLSKPCGVVGCTILGDGRVVTILDVDELIEQFHQRLNSTLQITDQRLSETRSLPTKSKIYTNSFSSQSYPQILVIDDSYTIRQMLALTLSRARYRVAQAKDGQDALDQLQGGLKVSLIIADIEMPRVDGFEFLRRLKTDLQLSTIPVAMLTSRSGAKHRQIALELGAVHYFTKPYSEQQILEVIPQLMIAK
jgi:chemotaxis family two-component system sensor histidine kinase/response regulator PixL